MLMSKQVSAQWILAVLRPLASTRWPETARWSAVKMVIYCQKQLPPKTATNGHLTAIFSKQSVRCFKTAWSQLQIRPKIVFQFKKLTNWWHFAWISCSFFINFIPNTHSKEYAHLKRVRIYPTYLDLFFTCWVIRVGMDFEINQTELSEASHDRKTYLTSALIYFPAKWTQQQSD